MELASCGKRPGMFPNVDYNVQIVYNNQELFRPNCQHIKIPYLSVKKYQLIISINLEGYVDKKKVTLRNVSQWKHSHRALGCISISLKGFPFKQGILPKTPSRCIELEVPNHSISICTVISVHAYPS